MCTLIGKRAEKKLAIIVNTPCCLCVEAIQDINPKFSRENGWEEIYIDEIRGDLPDWTHWIHYQPNGKLPDNLPLTTSDGRQLVWVDLEADVRMHFPRRPIGSLTHKGAVIHFHDWEHVRVLRSYVNDSLRKLSKYPRFENYLRMIPTEFLRKSARQLVLRNLDSLLKSKQ